MEILVDTGVLLRAFDKSSLDFDFMCGRFLVGMQIHRYQIVAGDLIYSRGYNRPRL